MAKVADEISQARTLATCKSTVARTTANRDDRNNPRPNKEFGAAINLTVIAGVNYHQVVRDATKHCFLGALLSSGQANLGAIRPDQGRRYRDAVCWTATKGCTNHKDRGCFPGLDGVGSRVHTRKPRRAIDRQTSGKVPLGRPHL